MTDPANDLWHALKERRDDCLAKGVRFSERQHHEMRQSYEAGTLIKDLNAAMGPRSPEATPTTVSNN